MIEAMWLEFVKAVALDAPEVSEVQRSEMRLAFYAGFTKSFRTIVKLSDELPEDQAAAVLDQVEAELRRYAESVARRAAHGLPPLQR